MISPAPRYSARHVAKLWNLQPGEVIQDPAAGTAGFLIAADRYIKKQPDDRFELTTKQQEFHKREVALERAMTKLPTVSLIVVSAVAAVAFAPSSDVARATSGPAPTRRSTCTVTASTATAIPSWCSSSIARAPT